MQKINLWNITSFVSITMFCGTLQFASYILEYMIMFQKWTMTQYDTRVILAMTPTYCGWCLWGKSWLIYWLLLDGQQ